MAEIVAKALTKTLVDGDRRFRLDIPDFALRSGDRKVIIGVTGSGKSTAMDLLALASRPDAAGQFELRVESRTTDLRKSPSSRSIARLRARHYGYVLQSSPLFPFLTFVENLTLGQRLAGHWDAEFVAELADLVQLSVAPRAHVGDLSVGQRQRIAVVRALAHRPSFIMCDEATAALDPRTADLVVRTVIYAAERTNAAILMITHDRRLAEQHGMEIFQVSARSNGRHGVLHPSARCS